MQQFIRERVRSNEPDRRYCMTSLYGSTAVPKKHFGRGKLLNIFYHTLEECIPGAWALNLGLQNLWQAHAPSHDWVLPDNFHVHVKEMNPQQHFVQFRDGPVAVEITMNQGTKDGLSLCPNIVHSIDGMVVREMTRRCSMSQQEVFDRIVSRKASEADEDMVAILWARYLESGFLSSRILDHLGSQHIEIFYEDVVRSLVQSLPFKGFSIMSIHD